MNGCTVILAGAIVVLAATGANADQLISGGENISADVAADGRVAFDLMGDIWMVRRNGGEAVAVTRNLRSAGRPRWSPDASRIAYQGTSRQLQGIWVYDFASKQSRHVSREGSFDRHPSWHPDGERIVYSSDVIGTGFDLWEVDLPSGLHWRLSDRPGDELEPAWSSNGRDLVYLHRHDDRWSLVLRRLGMPEEVLLSTTDRLAGPSWRPGGSLITYFRQRGVEASIDMVILSKPRLTRSYISDEDVSAAAVSWLDRHRMVYAAGGGLRQRLFNAWESAPLAFSARIREPQQAPAKALVRRRLEQIDAPDGRLVVHASRMFDGLGSDYQLDRDIVIDGGRITAVEPHSERTDSIVIDMGDLTVLPGYVDALANLSSGLDRFGDRLGPLLLINGVTTVVARHDDDDGRNARWSGKTMPGPRLLAATERQPAAHFSIADSMTPGLSTLLRSRQARLLDMPAAPARRFQDLPSLAAIATTVVLASYDNELPPGIALHAELRALTAAGLGPAQALRAAGANAAAALGADPWLGRIAVGAAADLLFVDGDPLANVEDALKIVAVVRNGRFFSARGLIDRLQSGQSVE